MTTVLGADSVPGKVRELLEWRHAEAARVDRIYQYLRPTNFRTSLGLVGQLDGPWSWLAPDTPNEVKRLAIMSRINMLKFVVDATVQVVKALIGPLLPHRSFHDARG